MENFDGNHTEQDVQNQTQERSTAQNEGSKVGFKVPNKSTLWLVLAIIIILIICLLFYAGIRNPSSFSKKKVEIPTSIAKAIEYLNKNSNYSNIINECRFEDFWPKEYFTINLKEKKISYWKDTAHVDVVYSDDTNNNNIKNFKEPKYKMAFSNFPEMSGLKSIVEKDYCTAINDATIDEVTKNLCYLYNALAGHPKSYIVLGRKKDDKWKFFKPSDFPKYHLQKSDLSNWVLTNVDSDGKIQTNVPSLNEAVKNLIVNISVKAISFDYRSDKIWYGDDSKGTKRNERSTLVPPYDYDSLYNVAACGWVVPDDGKKIIDAKEYFKPNEDIIFINEDGYNRLNELKWNEPENPERYPNIPLSFLFFIGIFILLYVWINYLKSKDANVVARMTNSPLNGIESPNSPTENNLQNQRDIPFIITNLVQGNDVIEEPKKDVKEEDAKAKAIEEFKKSEDYWKILEDTKKEAVKSFKNSKDFEEEINLAKLNAIKEYQGSQEHKNLKNSETNWKNLMRCTTEAKLLHFLSEIHKSHNEFPVIRTLYSAYNEAKGENTIDDQIAAILAILDEQVGSETGLKERFNILRDDAEYANNVRDSFEKTKSLAQEFGEREGYKQIVLQNKNLTIWERMAVMLWSMECSNKLLEIFDKNPLSTDIIDKAAEMYKDDILQIFATRIFKKYIDDSSAKFGEFTVSRKKMISEKTSEMSKKYHIQMPETPIYNEFVSSLDSIHDKAKSEAPFIQIMKELMVDEFIKIERKTMDRGQYLSMLVAMGFQMVDYIRYMSGNDIDYCSNMKFVLSGMSIDDKNAEFRYRDPAYSGDYTNRVYEWLQSVGIEHLKALVGNKLIMP